MGELLFSSPLRLIVGKVTNDFQDRLLPPKPLIWVSAEDAALVRHSTTEYKVLEGGIIYLKAAKGTTFARMFSDRSLGPGQCIVSSVLAVSLFHRIEVNDQPIEILAAASGKPKQTISAKLSLAPFHYASLDSVRTNSIERPSMDVAFLAKYILQSTLIAQGSFFVVNWFNRLDLVRVVNCEHEKVDNSTFNSSAQSQLGIHPLSVVDENTNLEFVSWQEDFLSVIESENLESNMKAYPTASELKGLLKQRIGGMDEIIEDLVDLSQGAISGKFRNMPRGYLFSGMSGTGKTYLAKQFASLSGLKTIAVNAPDLFQKGEGQTEAALVQLFERAIGSPSVIIIDELEAIASSRKTLEGAIERRLLARFLLILDEFYRKSDFSRSLCIGICGNASSLDPAILRPKRLERVFHFTIPSPQARHDILKIETAKFPKIAPETLETLSRRTPGYTGSDLASLCRHVLMAHIKMHGNQDLTAALPEISLQNFEASISVVKASALSAYSTSPQLVSFDELKGMDDIIEALSASVLAPFTQETRFKKLGAKPPSGVLLYGPPGVGKSKLAMAIANASKINFIAVNATEIISKVVGESEANLAEVFKSARAASPCILFLDQVESIAKVRGTDNTEEQSADRILSLLLTEMDGIQKQIHGKGEEESHLVVLAATNKPHLLDSAILRPGRFDHVLYIPPTNPTTRLSIIEHFATRTPTKGIETAQWTELAKRTKGFTGADIESLFREASYLALKKNIDADSISWQDILDVLPTVPASLFSAEITHPYNRNPGFAFID